MRQTSVSKHGKMHGKGQALTEYGLVLTLVAVACVGALSALGVTLSDGLASLSEEFIMPVKDSGNPVAGGGAGNGITCH